jgi:hypothetical protein
MKTGGGLFIFVGKDSSRVSSAITAIHAGDVDSLKPLAADPSVATIRIGSPSEARTLLHILADWPCHLPSCSDTARTLIAAEVDAPFIGDAHSETALHFTASCDDVALLDVLLDAGANINAPGGVIAETPLADARAFKQLKAAHRLVERGARVTLQDAATLGLDEKVEFFFSSPTIHPSKKDVDCALWNACHGGQLKTAQYVYSQGGAINCLPPWGEELTPLDAARGAGAADVTAWLEAIGANRFQNRGGEARE